ncbi:hypothetical protein KIW84_058293 [Lathyrus oleraceus]|uniref:ABC transporter domain-containing protein n=1 Tax=Pisum sativum TaxID=3888 RepID=A0A9D4X5X4_PEA|nr:hypothetical protein KIW84_058293 [Pisum sativum]
MLATSRGVANEIDILTDLGFQERQKLLDRLINVAEEGNEKFLLKLKERIDRVGIEVPTIEAVSTGGQQESVVTDYVLKLSCRLLKQYLLLLLINQVASGLFRAIAALGRNMIVANTFGSFALLTLLTLGGFIMSRKDIKSWWIWGYWISPLMYGQNAIMFTPNSNKTLGIQVLESRGFFTDAYWYWIGVGALVGFMFLYNIIFTVALTHLNPFDKAQATINEESEDSTTNGTHQEVELPRIASSGESSSRRQKRGMVLPFEPHSITFDEVVYSVDMPQEMKIQGVMEDRLVLLKGVSGAFRPGVLTALMGVSGAGKTTLMDVLAGRKTGGYIDGSIKISGYPKKQETFARISGYCEQNDIHSPHVTVHESLLYSAWLRLPAEVDYNTRKMFIEEVMELVELNPLRNSLVGLPGVNGLSTEQLKRLTIAVELVANPSIIFILSLLGLTPLAERVSFLTEQIAIFTGPTVGGLLNATCGNVTELIIAIFALTTNKIAVVKYSLLGSVLSNLLLVLGTSLLCGGIANIGEEQKYDRRQADVNSLMLLLALLCHLLPLLFTYSAASAELTVKPSLYLSRASSIVMLVAYFAYLIFQLWTHRQLFEAEDEGEGEGENNGAEEEAVIGFWSGFAWLAGMTVFIAWLSEYVVDTIEDASDSWGLSVSFLSIILLPIVGNAAEHAGAIIFAFKNKLDISLGVALGSSTQIAMFVLFTESKSEVRKSSNDEKCGEICILFRVSAGTTFCFALTG